MSDLTKRLRDIPNSDGVQFEAADRIEYLERVLAQARKALDSGSWDYGTDQDEHKECDKAIAAIDEALNARANLPATRAQQEQR